MNGSRRSEATRSAQVAQFMKDMLKGVGPGVALGRDTKLLRELLNQTAERLSKDLAGQPEVEADLRETLGGVYLAISEFDQAEATDREALRLRRKLSGPEHLAVARVLDHLAEVLRQKGRKLEEAGVISREALAIRRKRLGNEHLEVASSLVTLGNVLDARSLRGRPGPGELPPD